MTVVSQLSGEHCIYTIQWISDKRESDKREYRISGKKQVGKNLTNYYIPVHKKYVGISVKWEKSDEFLDSRLSKIHCIYIYKEIYYKYHCKYKLQSIFMNFILFMFIALILEVAQENIN